MLIKINNNLDKIKGGDGDRITVCTIDINGNIVDLKGFVGPTKLINEWLSQHPEYGVIDRKNKCSCYYSYKKLTAWSPYIVAGFNMFYGKPIFKTLPKYRVDRNNNILYNGDTPVSI